MQQLLGQVCPDSGSVSVSVLTIHCNSFFFHGRHLTSHSRVGTGINNKSMMVEFPLPCLCFGVPVLCMLAHCHNLFGHLNRAEPLLMLLVTHVLL